MSSKGSRGTRNSCENCRNKKARCQWSCQERVQCDRCAKSGLQCRRTPMLPTGRPRLRTRRASISRSLHQGIAAGQVLEADIRPSFVASLQPYTPTTEADAPVESLGVASWDTEQLFIPGLSANALAPSACQTEPNLPLSTSRQLLDSEPSLWSNFNDQFSQWPFEDLGVIRDQLVSNSPGRFALEKARHPSSEQSRDYYLDRLTSLNAALTRKLTASSSATARGNQPRYPTASQLLQFTQEYMRITKHFMLAVPLMSAPSLTTRSIIVESDTDDDDNDVEFAFRHDTDANGTETSDTSSSYSVQDTAAMSIDYPTMIALITSYSSLVRLHRNWLQTMLSALRTATSRQEQLFSNLSTPCRHMLDGYPAEDADISSELPTVLPDLALDGFSLSRHRSLQIQIVSETSLEILWRAERGIASLAANCGNDSNCQSREDTLGGDREDIEGEGVTNYLGVLRSMLSQEAATTNSSSSSRTATTSIPTARRSVGWRSLNSMAKQMKKETRRNFCLQLEEGGILSGIDNFDF